MRMIFTALATWAVSGAGAALAATPTVADLSQLSIEELSNIEVTSVSKRAEPVSRAPAAIFVITAEDIRRSGAASLPEVLRLAPNLSVQQLDALDYAISARGFNGFETANKLLVLIDGRSVYTPLHSGVFWGPNPMMLADVERIEVISGPGGTLWGANAVNGVVNIVTRSAHDTKGLLVDGAGGDAGEQIAVRYGGDMGARGAWRAYVQGEDYQGSGGDRSDRNLGGFRMDWSRGASSFTLQGDVSRMRQLDGVEISDRHNLVGRMSRSLAGGGSLDVQAYYDWVQRDLVLSREATATYDVELRHTLAAKGRHQIIWGAGHRIAKDEFETGLPSTLLPANRTLGLSNIFIQDQIALRDRLSLTLGLKLEESNFTGGEYLPNARLAWRPNDETLLWAAASRAVRTPSRIERELVLPGFLVGGDFQSETLEAYEAGYRGQLSAKVSLSASVFYNVYGRLRTAEFTPPAPGSFPIFFANGAEGETYGIEVWGDYAVNESWRLSAGFSKLHKRIGLKPGSLDITGIASHGADPEYEVKLRSQARLSDRLELDIRARAIGELPGGAVSDYVEADARLGWRVRPNLELSVAGFNLLDSAHREIIYATAVETRRNVRVGLRWVY